MSMDRIMLDENDMPKSYYNILPDLPEPFPPPLDPRNMQPAPPQALEAIFPKEIVRQEMSGERTIAIPTEVRDILINIERPTPLFRAHRLEKYLKTPAKIYYKYEGLNPVGSHKINTAIAQAYYNKKEGVENLATETGAGQWGSALSLACTYFDLKCRVFMVRISYDQKPGRKIMMESYGAEINPSPSDKTEYGRQVLKKDPKTNGSLGIAISEAIEAAVTGKNTKYSLGSVLNHVMLHQTVIGQEVKKQLEIAEAKPDIMIACIGGGSNFGGFIFPFVKDNMDKKTNTKFIGVEPDSCASVTKGEYKYDHGDSAKMTPLLKMYTLGSDFMPPPSHAGGLRYHGMAPTVSMLMKHKICHAETYTQEEVLDAARIFSKTEGILPAPESAHAIKSALVHALECKKKNEEKTIVFNLSGHGLFDMNFYKK